LGTDTAHSASDWTFVTKNAVDFRGPSAKLGSKSQYAGIALHAGLVCLIGPPGMDLNMQIEPFEQAMDEIGGDDDLVNQVLAITMEGDSLHIQRYRLPKE